MDKISANGKSDEGPREIIWLLTARCNLACCHCYTARFLGKGELEPDQAVRLVKDAANAGVRHIGFSGGEVFLRQDTLELIDLASKLGMSTSVVTNGSTLNEEVVEKLANYQVYTVLSIDGATKEIHEKIRGIGSWDFLIPAMERMRQFGVHFSTVMAANQVNYQHVSEYIALAQHSGALAACLIPVMPTGRANMELILQPEQMLTVLQAADKAAETLKFRVHLWCTSFAGLVTNSPYITADFCRDEETETIIAPSGDVLLCDILDIILSNVQEKGLVNAWQKRTEHPVFEALTNPRLSKPCLDCPLKSTCKGGCFARAELISGDLFAPDPLCPRVTKVL